MKLLLLVICSLIATSFAVPADKEEKLEAVLKDIEEALQGFRDDQQPVPKEDKLPDLDEVEIEGDLAEMKTSQRTFNDDMEEVLLHTDDIAEAEAEVEALGGRVMIQLGHDLLVAKVPSRVAADHAFTQSSTHISNSASATTMANVMAYHQSREDELKPQPPVMSWTAKTAPMSFPREDSDAAIQGESPYRPTLTGKIAVVALIASGPGGLAISQSECRTILSEVQTGLRFWVNQAPASKRLSFQFYWGLAKISTTDYPYDCPPRQAEVCHDRFANDLLRAFRYPIGQAGRDRLAQNAKGWARADGAFIAFFSKYKQSHFAYAFFGGGPTYMQYSNDGWGPQQIDRVFAHEMGHIFNAPDEYTNCNCNARYGRGGCTDTNDNCAQSGGPSCTARQQNCIMDSNDLNHICEHSKRHVGWC